MQLMNTILGFVLECETDYKVFNPSQEQWYTLSKEQFSKLNVGNFFTFKEIVYSCSNKDVISCDGHFYFVKNRRFFDLETGKQLRTPPVLQFTNVTFPIKMLQLTTASTNELFLLWRFQHSITLPRTLSTTCMPCLRT